MVLTATVGLCLAGCGKAAPDQSAIVVTIPPLKLILQEITGDPDAITCILPPGASPHTFELRPSVAKTIDAAAVLLYVDESIDGWAARLAPDRGQAVFEFVPPDMRRPYPHHADDHGHTHGVEADNENGALNAHFWADPVVVRAIVPDLVATLSEADPDGAARYRENGDQFVAALNALDEKLAAGRPEGPPYALAAFHPSWSYFFARYGVDVAAYIEPFPGKEPTPRALQALQEALKGAERRVILSEAQLPAKPAEVLAESTDASLVVIDPLGGEGPHDSYAGLLRANADRIWEALR